MATAMERTAELVSEWQAEASRHKRAADEGLRAIDEKYERMVREMMAPKEETPPGLRIVTLPIPHDELEACLTRPQMFRLGRIKCDETEYDGRRWAVLAVDKEAWTFDMWELLVDEGWTEDKKEAVAEMLKPFGVFVETWAERLGRGFIKPSMEAPAGLRVVGPDNREWVIGTARVTVKGER